MGGQASDEKHGFVDRTELEGPPGRDEAQAEAEVAPDDRLSGGAQGRQLKGLSRTVAGLAVDRAKVMELFEPTARMVEQFQRHLSMSEGLMRSVYASNRVLDRVVPNLIKPWELAASSQLTKMVSGQSPLFTARLALDAEFHMAEMLKHVQLPTVQLAVLRQASVAISSLSESLIARSQISWGLERSMATVLAGWQVAIAQSAIREPIDFGWLTAAGMTTWESASAIAIILQPPDVEIEEPEWEQAPGDVGARLRARLSDLDPGLERKLDGARERLATPGPDCCRPSGDIIDRTDRLGTEDSGTGQGGASLACRHRKIGLRTERR